MGATATASPTEIATMDDKLRSSEVLPTSAPSTQAGPTKIDPATDAALTDSTSAIVKPSDNPTKVVTSEPPEANDFAARRTWKFWAIFVSLCLISFVSALDATIVSTALPTITRSIGGSESDYAWIANCFMITSTALQPLFAQIANIFGRRTPMLVALVIFALGSAIAGAARNVAMIIAGRSIQGIGVAGLYVLLDVIVCDMVPLRSRAKYLGVLLGVAGIAMPVAPVLGGAIAEADWRWCFYLNLPFAGICILSVIFFLNVGYKKSPTWQHALKRVDFTGNLIFIPSIVAVIYGLVSGGVVHPWSSYKVIVPIVLGCLGWAGFHIQQRFVPEPSVPWRLFQNRTSSSAYAQVFFTYIIQSMLIYFLPVFFMGVQGQSPLRAGVRMLPLCVAIVPFAILAGQLVEKTGQYKPFHWLGHGFLALGMGLFSICDQNSGAAMWASFQIIMAIGAGMVLSTFLTAILAALPESDVATATGVYSFLRQFGMIWGVTIGAVIFNSEFDLGEISDDPLAERLSNGGAYGQSSAQLYNTISESDRETIISAYVPAIAAVFYAGAAFEVLGFFLVFVEKRIALRKTLDTEYGLGKEGVKASAEVKEISEKPQSV